MKTRIKFFAVCLMAISSTLFSSCEEDGDIVKPVINLIAPEEGAVLEIGDDHGIHLDMILTDDVMLKSYKIDIHSNFDNHVHSRSTESTVDFSFNKSWDVSGRKATIHHHEIKIPADATPGNYHLLVFCIDAAGNEADVVARNIVLSHDGE